MAREIGVSQVIPIAEAAIRSPGPAGIFTLRFSGQTILTAGGNPASRQFLLRELRAIIGGVIPAYRLHGIVWIARKSAGVAANQRLILSLGYRINPHPKSPGDGYRRLRTLDRKS